MNQKGQQSSQSCEKTGQGQQTTQHQYQAGGQSAQSNEQGQSQQQHEMLFSQKQQPQQQQKQPIQPQFVSQQQQQPHYHPNVQTQQHPKMDTETSNFQQGGGCSMAQTGSIQGNREKQGSISQMSTAQFPEDQQRSSMSMKSGNMDANQTTTNQFSQQGTQPNISSLRNIPNITSGEKMESPLQPFGQQNKIQQQGSSEQNMGIQQNNLNQIFVANNPNNNALSNTQYNSSFNNSFNNNLNNPSNILNHNASNNNNPNNLNNNLPLVQPVLYHNNQQAASNSNLLQQTPNMTQLNFLNTQQTSTLNPQLVNSPFSQIPNQYHVMFHQGTQQIINTLPPATLNYGLLQMQSSNLVNQQQSQQQQIIHAQQQNQLQLKQQQLGGLNFSPQLSATLSSPHHQQMPQVMQQQQLQKNYNTLNPAKTASVQNNQIQEIKQMTASSQIYASQLQTGSSANLQSQSTGGYTQNTGIGGIFGYPQPNQTYQSNFPGLSMQNQVDMRNVQESFVASSNLPPFQQNTVFSEKMRGINDKKGESEILPSKPNSIEKGVLQSHELQNSHKQAMNQIKQNHPFQSNQKIKKEEDNHRSPSPSSNFIISENKQLQKYPDRITDNSNAGNIDTSNFKKNPMRSDQQKERYNDQRYNQSENVEDHVIEEETEGNQLGQRVEYNQRFHVSQVKSQDSAKVSNQKFYKKETKKRKVDEILECDQSQHDKNCELTDDRSLPQSRSSGLNLKNQEDQSQFNKQSKSSVSSSREGVYPFSNKKSVKISTKQREHDHHLIDSTHPQTQVIELLKMDEIFGQLSSKKVKQNKSDITQGGMGFVSLTFIGGEYQSNLSIPTNQSNQYQKQWPIDYEKLRNLQKNAIPESKLLHGTVPQIKIPQSQANYDQSNLKQFHEKKESLKLFEQGQEITKFASQPFANNSNQPESFSTNVQMGNPVQSDFQRKFEFDQQKNQCTSGQSQYNPMQQLSAPRIGTSADSKIINNAPKNQFLLENDQNQIYFNMGSNLAYMGQNNQGFNRSNEEGMQSLQLHQNTNPAVTQTTILGSNFQPSSANQQMQFTQNERNNSGNENQSTNVNQNNLNLLNPMDIQVSLFSFMLEVMEKSQSLQQELFKNLSKKISVQDKILQTTLYMAQDARQSVDEMILQSTEIQGQSGLLDFMRGRLKDYVRNNPNMLIDYDGSQLDPQACFYTRFELVLKETWTNEPLIKDKNFIVPVSLIDSVTKKEVYNLEPIPVRLRMYTYSNPPQAFESDYVKGVLGLDVVKGNCTFRKIHIKQVTSHQKQRAMFIVIEPDVELMFNLPPIKLQKLVPQSSANEQGKTPRAQQSQHPQNPSSSQIVQENLSSKSGKEQQSQLEKSFNIKQESHEKHEKEDDFSKLNKQEGVPSTSNLNSSKPQLTQQQSSQISQMSEAPQSPVPPPPKKRNARKKKETQKTSSLTSRSESDIVRYKINPILIKPLILEQIVVKSKNNATSKQ